MEEGREREGREEGREREGREEGREREGNCTREIWATFLDVAWVQNNKIQLCSYWEIIVTYLDFTDCLILF